MDIPDFSRRREGRDVKLWRLDVKINKVLDSDFSKNVIVDAVFSNSSSRYSASVEGRIGETVVDHAIDPAARKVLTERTPACCLFCKYYQPEPMAAGVITWHHCFQLCEELIHVPSKSRRAIELFQKHALETGTGPFDACGNFEQKTLK